MSKKFSALAVLAMSAFESVAQAEHDLEVARDEADKSAEAVVSALKSLPPPHRVALVDEDCDVSIYSLVDGEDGAGYKVEFIRGDFDVPDRDGDEPAAPVVPEPEPEPEPVLDAYAEFAVS